MIIQRCSSIDAIKRFAQEALAPYFQNNSITQSSHVFIKPNANSNMNALTGNTTDLRILSSIVNVLQDHNVNKITIGDGTNSGFYREGIDVLDRLRIKALAKLLNVNAVDLNHAKDTFDVSLEDGIITQAASIAQKADFFINAPKVKMHYEATMSCCLKNLMGTLKGRENKKKIHESLYKNIVNLNKQIKPHLHIVDGLVCMEGNGPTAGTPVRRDLLLAGENPWELDAAVAGIAGLSWNDIPILIESKMQSIITDKILNDAETYGRTFCTKPFLKPHNNLLVSLVTNKRLQKYFLIVRYSPGIKQLANSRIGKRIMNILGVSQEVFIFKEPLIYSISYDRKEFDSNDIEFYRNVCPRFIKELESIGNDECLKCLYCYSTDPKNKIKIEGDLGFFNQQDKRYGKLIHNLYQNIL